MSFFWMKLLKILIQFMLIYFSSINQNNARFFINLIHLDKSRLPNQISLSPENWWDLNRMAWRLDCFALNLRASYQFWKFSIFNCWFKKIYFIFSQFFYPWILILTSVDINRQDTLIDQVRILFHNSLSQFCIFLIYFLLLSYSFLFPVQLMNGSRFCSLSGLFFLNFL